MRLDEITFKEPSNVTIYNGTLKKDIGSVFYSTEKKSCFFEPQPFHVFSLRVLKLIVKKMEKMKR